MDFRAQIIGSSEPSPNFDNNQRRLVSSALSEGLLKVPVASHFPVPLCSLPAVQCSTKVIPSKRGFDAISQAESILDLSYDEDDNVEEAVRTRARRHGKKVLDTADFEIPCICYMSGRTDYKKCIKRHKYLSHLARHLYSHDIYICQMCFTKFDGASKEQNLQRKRQHHCVKVCNNGNCKRQQLHAAPSMSDSRTCEHLCTWQERWKELFRAVFPDILPIPALPTPIAQHSASQNLQCIALASLSPTQEDSFQHAAWSDSPNMPRSLRRELPNTLQYQSSYSYETQRTKFIQSGSSLTSAMAPTSFTSDMAGSLQAGPQLEAIRGNAGGIMSSPLRHEHDFLDNTGLGTAQLGAFETHEEDLFMFDLPTSELNPELNQNSQQSIEIECLMTRVKALEMQGQNQEDRIKALETALQQSRHREQEL